MLQVNKINKEQQSIEWHLLISAPNYFTPSLIPGKADYGGSCNKKVCSRRQRQYYISLWYVPLENFYMAAFYVQNPVFIYTHPL